MPHEKLARNPCQLDKKEQDKREQRAESKERMGNKDGAR